MKDNSTIIESLNEQQVMMLRLLKTPLSDEAFQQLRRLAVTLLAKQVDEKLEGWEDSVDYNKLTDLHFRTSSHK